MKRLTMGYNNQIGLATETHFHDAIATLEIFKWTLTIYVRFKSTAGRIKVDRKHSHWFEQIKFYSVLKKNSLK